MAKLGVTGTLLNRYYSTYLQIVVVECKQLKVGDVVTSDPYVEGKYNCQSQPNDLFQFN